MTTGFENFKPANDPSITGKAAQSLGEVSATLVRITKDAATALATASALAERVSQAERDNEALRERWDESWRELVRVKDELEDLVREAEREHRAAAKPEAKRKPVTLAPSFEKLKALLASVKVPSPFLKSGLVAALLAGGLALSLWPLLRAARGVA